jgi:hypothetical protein
MGKDLTLKPSALEKFSLSYEYDVTWPAAKKAIRVRTHNN